MQALPTCEVRWFFKQSPIRIDELFTTTHRAPTRVDWYALPSDFGCGIKIREGRLEAKLRQETVGRQHFQSATGIVEKWIKWGAPLEDSIPESILATTQWLPVTKQRHVRRFEITDNSITEITSLPKSGCSFEITVLTINERNWETVGFEAVGHEKQLKSNLACLIRHMENQVSLTSEFNHSNSIGYPEWLNHNFCDR